MTREELEQRIAKKEADIEKIKKRIAKWEASKSEEAFVKYWAPWYSQEPKKVKTMDDLIQARFNCFTGRETFEETTKRIQDDYDGHIRNCDNEIRYANRDLNDANVTLDKYHSALNIQTARAEATRIQVLVDFLDAWKAEVEEYIVRDAVHLKDLYKWNHEMCDKHNSGWYRNHPEVNERQEYRDYINQMHNIHPFTKECFDKAEKDYINHSKLNELLEKEKEARYWDLINRITEVAGEIQDASDLRMSPKGNIDGFVTGSKNKVHIETIGAGGYNIQCFHYRVLVHIVR